MQQIKARSSRHVQIEFPELRKRYWGTLFWARGFFSTTWGRVGLSAENPFKDFALLFSANDIRLLG
jgi:REP element-mobilizing transposase RayT